MSSDPSNDWEIESIHIEALPLLPGSALRARFIEKTTLIPSADDEEADSDRPVKDDYFGP